jgi:hypothetical protein
LPWRSSWCCRRRPVSRRIPSSWFSAHEVSKSFYFIFGSLAVSFFAFFVTVNISEEALEVSLVFASGFVLCFFECGIANVDLAVFAPVLWLFRVSKYFETR